MTLNYKQKLSQFFFQIIAMKLIGDQDMKPPSSSNPASSIADAKKIKTEGAPSTSASTSKSSSSLTSPSDGVGGRDSLLVNLLKKEGDSSPENQPEKKRRKMSSKSPSSSSALAATQACPSLAALSQRLQVIN